MKKFRLLVILSFLMTAIGASAQTEVYQSLNGPRQPLHVDGNNLKDPFGNKVVLHGVMDTPSPYFNEWRWGSSATDNNVDNCIDYFDAIFDVITDNEKGAYCNLFRLHLDPAWTNGKAGSWEVDSRETGTGEADISHYESARLDKYLNSVYIPIAQKAIKHKMYVIMRPPGVCPGNIYVGGSYQKYLLDVWDRVSKHRLIQKYCGQIGLELANEPVGVKLADGSESEKALHDFFQPIVDKIRANGFKGGRAVMPIMRSTLSRGRILVMPCMTIMVGMVVTTRICRLRMWHLPRRKRYSSSTIRCQLLTQIQSSSQRLTGVRRNRAPATIMSMANGWKLIMEVGQQVARPYGVKSPRECMTTMAISP